MPNIDRKIGLVRPPGKLLPRFTSTSYNDTDGGYNAQQMATIEAERIKSGLDLGEALSSGDNAGGDLTGTFPNPTLVGVGVTPGTYPLPTSLQVDSKGRVLDVDSTPFAEGEFTDLTVTQAATPTISGVSAFYQRVGAWVRATIHIAITGNGTAANDVVVTNGSLPDSAASGRVCGNGLLVIAGTLYPVTVILATTSTFKFRRTDAPPTGFVGNDPNAALANGDSIEVVIQYRA